jgi:hypothetical protein
VVSVCVDLFIEFSNDAFLIGAVMLIEEKCRRIHFERSAGKYLKLSQRLSGGKSELRSLKLMLSLERNKN